MNPLAQQRADGNDDIEAAFEKVIAKFKACPG